jgi:hypothetical protein
VSVCYIWIIVTQMSVLLDSERQRQEDGKFKADLGYTMNPI